MEWQLFTFTSREESQQAHQYVDEQGATDIKYEEIGNAHARLTFETDGPLTEEQAAMLMSLNPYTWSWE